MDEMIKEVVDTEEVNDQDTELMELDSESEEENGNLGGTLLLIGGTAAATLLMREAIPRGWKAVKKLAGQARERYEIWKKNKEIQKAGKNNVVDGNSEVVDEEEPVVNG